MDQFAPSARSQSGAWCRPCCNEYNRSRWPIRREQALAYARRRRQRLGADAMSVERRSYWRSMKERGMLALGGAVCECCGETERSMLVFAHRNHDGAEHRRSLGADAIRRGGAQHRLMRWIIENPAAAIEKMKVLCANCNTSEARSGGQCAHKDPAAVAAAMMAKANSLFGSIERKLEKLAQ